MNPTASFVVSEFTNPSGEVVFRVSGWLHGKRVRRNFPSRAEADTERQLLEIQRLQAETGVRTAVTRLTDEHLASLGLQVSSLDFRRFCKRRGIRCDTMETPWAVEVKCSCQPGPGQSPARYQSREKHETKVSFDIKPK